MYIYEVRAGDTLAAVARRLGVTEAQLMAANQLPTRTLTRGQALLVPSTRYTVRPGDDLFTIARRAGVELAELRRTNPGVDPAALQPGQTLTIPRPDPLPADVMGYLPIIEPGVTAADLRPWTGLLTYVPVFSHLIDAAGNLAPIADEAAIRAAYPAGAQPLMVIANMEAGGVFSPEIARGILADPQARGRALDGIIRVVEQKGYGGVDSDIENIPRDLRAEYVSFLRDLKRRLGRRVLTAAVPPKWNETTFYYARGHDYAGIGRVVDRVFLMNYEFHWVGGPPGPIAPLPEIRRVMQYAASLMPRRKIINGINVMAYDWPLPDTPENVATARTGAEALLLAVRNQVPIRYDETRATPWFRYQEGDVTREVWFEDVRSLMAKLRLIRQLGLGGMGIWHVGAPLPGLATLMQYLLRVRTGAAAAPGGAAAPGAGEDESAAGS